MSNTKESRLANLLTSKKKPVNEAAVQKLIPGAKTNANCADTCVVLMNAVNLNHRLLAMMFVYRAMVIEMAQKARAQSQDRSVTQHPSYDYGLGFGDCASFCRSQAQDMLAKEEPFITNVVSIIRSAEDILGGKSWRHMTPKEQELSRRLSTLRDQMKNK